MTDYFDRLVNRTIDPPRSPASGESGRPASGAAVEDPFESTETDRDERPDERTTPAIDTKPIAPLPPNRPTESHRPEPFDGDIGPPPGDDHDRAVAPTPPDSTRDTAPARPADEPTSTERIDPQQDPAADVVWTPDSPPTGDAERVEEIDGPLEPNPPNDTRANDSPAMAELAELDRLLFDAAGVRPDWLDAGEPTPRAPDHEAPVTEALPEPPQSPSNVRTVEPNEPPTASPSPRHRIPDVHIDNVRIEIVETPSTTLDESPASTPRARPHLPLGRRARTIRGW